ncbi:MAG: hypothetical protein WA892_09100 [Ornithinimicrobium sp.]
MRYTVASLLTGNPELPGGYVEAPVRDLWPVLVRGAWRPRPAPHPRGAPSAGPT